MRCNTFISNLALSAALFGGCSMTNAQCFDLTKVGDKDVIRCINYDLGETTRNGEQVEYGWKPSLSPDDHPRQMLMTEPGTDDICPNLNVLPPNGAMSIRLASTEYLNETDSAQAAYAAHYITVTEENPIIVLHYAAVMHNPKHSIATLKGFEDYAQPYVKIQLVDLNKGTFIECPSLIHYPAVAASVEGWQEGTDSNEKAYIWKDWSSVVMDLTDYIGQKICLTLATYDCAESEFDASNKKITLCTERHKARMYYALDCERKVIDLQQTCAKADSITLTAPAHYLSYRWYETTHADETLATTPFYSFPAPQNTDVTYACEIQSLCGTETLQHFVYATRHYYTRPDTLDYGETYDWYINGTLHKNYTYSTRDTVRVPHVGTGCDSIVYYLDLQIKTDFCDGVFSFVRDTLCADSTTLLLQMYYEHGGLKSYSLLFDDAAHKAGFEDVLQAASSGETQIPIQLPTTYILDSTYTRPGTYSVTVVEENVCNQTIEHTLSFTILYPSSIIFRRWDDILAIKNSRYNGNYQFSRVRWYKNGEEVKSSGEHGAYYYEQGKFQYESQDEYYAALTRSDDGQTVCSCRYIPKRESTETPQGDQYDRPEVVYDSNASDAVGRRVIRVRTTQTGHYTLYDISGRAVQAGRYGDESGISNLPLASHGVGIYVLILQSTEGNTSTHKLLID